MTVPAAAPRPPTPVRPGRMRLVLRELRSWRPTVARLAGLVRSAVTLFVVLGGTLWLMPGVDADGLIAIGWVVVLVAVVGALLRPVLLALATVLGGLGAMIVGASLQTIILYVALRLAPDAHLSGLPAAFAASWFAVALAAVVNWLTDSGTDDAFVSEALRLMRKVSRTAQKRGTAPEGDGLLVVQLDGVSAPLLRWAIHAGNLPNTGRWLRLRSHRLSAWHTGLPATTPGAQAGILHGDDRSVPAFRWYDKEAGRLMVANRPRDAAEIERQLSDGRGLLRDGGVSISNIFSGDAPATLFTVSRATLPGRSSRGYAEFMISPAGFARAIVLGLGRVLKELHQARGQRLRDIRPRVSRSGAFLVLRPLAGMLRDMNVSLIAEQMALGAPVIFCDFVDYDEVAHHAGPARPESLDALGRLDQVLGVLERLAAEADRRYHLVVLSDHGQSQGETFRQRYGESLAQTVDRLVNATAEVARAADDSTSPVGGTNRASRNGSARGERTASAATGPVEHWGPVNTLLTEISGRPGPGAAATRAAVRSRTVDREVRLGPAREPATPPRPGPAGEAQELARTDVLVVASGNLAMVYFTRYPGKPTRAEIEAAHPGLVNALAAHPGVGVVVVGDESGPVAVGKRGEHHLGDGRVTGEDPLAGYGPRAATDLLRHQEIAHVGDLVLISTIDSGTEEVAAFEELVGSHGGLGGWQTDAFLLHPAEWPVEADPLIGPVAVHRQLLAWLRQLGLREADEPATTTERVAAPILSADRAFVPTQAPVGGRSGPGTPPDHTDDLADRHHDDDRDQDPLPGLGEDRAAEDAEAGVDHRPEPAGRGVGQREAPPV
ncbi:type I phosphodiesterase/nucleotide pyrophosphatase [Micromonospora pisi]|uniref:Type I phosphodiesterase/nucleotide pyrophosphatase n=1 Tax=Micromonospora pisi TaxID=589240 RepID=A0A495JIC3_9ACTN|nr:alkaline phosphatase family protein [Micromonospora pisi]RKR87809.1 type I phosphodiesterase/nucleotide pyrophosphatase [Micromonospora pisi]